MAGDTSPYVGLITSEHAGKPKFLASVTASLQPFADSLALLSGLSAQFDIDQAEGSQLDIVGQWIGLTRYVSTQLVGTYFSFDIDGIGLDQGVIWNESEPLTGLTTIPDDIYRLLLKAKIVANHWDGSVPGAYSAWNTILRPSGFQILIQDNGDMTMLLALYSTSSNLVITQLFASGVLDLRPAGVGITYVTPTMMSVPLFGLDMNSDYVSGLDYGAFGTFNQ